MTPDNHPNHFGDAGGHAGYTGPEYPHAHQLELIEKIDLPLEAETPHGHRIYVRMCRHCGVLEETYHVIGETIWESDDDENDEEEDD